MGRREFTPEFKREAVKLVRERGVTVTQARGILGSTYNVLRQVGEGRQGGASAGVSGSRQDAAGRCGGARLRRELAQDQGRAGHLKKSHRLLREGAAVRVRVHREAPRRVAARRCARRSVSRAAGSTSG